jgi:hypothetical protein
MMTWEEWLKYYKALKREFWICVLAVFFILTTPFLICCGGGNAEAEQQTVFEQAVTEYEQMTGRKIYPSGREFLRKAAEQKGLNTKSEIMDLIKYNEKFMFK